ncbi:ATP-binding protein [Nocardioides insulae]|uniref:ATP-binding protein n=1 Tax=Nocardioides insulae TaxID=394734 RepID=UPI001FE1950B|nr:ATP-binding protein [Nocardioides insulae]
MNRPTPTPPGTATSPGRPLPPPPPPPPSAWAPRRATRDTRSPVIGGVAAGLARHLGLPVLWVRVGLIVATVLGGGMGVFLYAALWVMLPADSGFETGTPGEESASRGGRRPQGQRTRWTDAGPAVALAVLGLGALLTLQAMVGAGVLFWPVVLGVAGLALIWRQADEAQRERWRHSTGSLDPLRMIVGEGWAAWARILGGVLLLVMAGLLIFLDGGSLRSDGWGVVIAVVFVFLGIALVCGPWLFRLATDLSAEREERIRTQERADMAAHLHDSVLQTLAMIQKNAGDPATVARLARAQERDLRGWLYADEPTAAESLAGALKAAAAEVEDQYGITVDVVTVGDLSYADAATELATRPLVAATREALVNAAKHAGTDRVDVYAEVGGDRVEAFVRDRGRGFDLDEVPTDRYGVRGSILARMERHGGEARVRSAPGEGTEVRLTMPLDGEPGSEPAHEPASEATTDVAGGSAGSPAGAPPGGPVASGPVASGPASGPVSDPVARGPGSGPVSGPDVPPGDETMPLNIPIRGPREERHP